jgi:hypothetical protein
MSENTKPNNERPADLAVQDSVGGMARRLLNPAHLRDLAGRSVKTLREQGAEQLWRDVKFRVGLAMHHDDWRHRADIPLRRELKAQRAAHLQGPKISIIVPLYNTPAKLFDEMLQSVVRQTYTNWELVLVDASDADKRLERRLAKAVPGTIVYEPIENGGIALNTTRGFALAHGEYRKEAAEQLCSLLPEDKVYDRNYPEEQRQRNLLALFPRGMMLSCGRVEKGEFVVENTCCAQDHVLDLPRMERMERALADFAKQEANKKEN